MDRSRARNPLRHGVAATGALIVIFIVMLAAASRADSRDTGSIDGRVLDAAAQAVAGVVVTLTTDRGERTATTGADGRFLFVGLPPGDYIATLELAGSSIAKADRLEAGARATLDFRLDLATEATIDAIAVAPLVDPRDAGISTTLDAAAAAELVFASRNYQAVISSMPGVVNEPGVPSTLTPAVNGALWQENSAFLDGVDITDTRSGGSSRTFLPTSALAEVRSDGSGYGVEYGRAVGGVTGAVTKSGTNDFHGDFLYIAQSPSWRAQSEIAPIDRDDELVSGYETSLGGPIVRDRAWFFAAAGDNTTNIARALASGDVIDTSQQSESLVGKIALDASRRHHFTLTAIDSVASLPVVNTTTAELLAVTASERGTTFVTATWGFTAGSAVFVEVRGARQRATSDRTQVAFATVTPGASPDDPAGNQSSYMDTASGLSWHASDLPLGPGTLEFPRDQGNATVSWLFGRHQIGLGADYQDVGWDALNRPPSRYLGGGYDPALPGGFAAPQLKRVFLPIDEPVGTRSSNLAAFAQDDIDASDRLRINVGLRIEDQTHDDDRGNEVLASTDLSPRAAASYDLRADGRLLLEATLGRYVTHIPQEFLNQEFASLPNGANAFDEYVWNAHSRRYDIFNRRQLPALRAPVEDIEPYTKDEATVGVEWQFRSAWTLDARAIAWRIEAPFSATDQFDERGAVYRLLTNFDEGEREYSGLQLDLERAFRDGLLIRANYTWSRLVGNSVGSTGGGDDFLEAMAVLDPEAGAPVTAVNRHGRMSLDRTHILNLAGAKRVTRGRHSFALGGWLAYRSGEPWGLLQSVVVRPGDAAPTILTTRYVEPRDRHQLPDTWTLDLTSAWELPITSAVSGSVRVEVVNATDEQEQVSVTPSTGLPVPVAQSYQTPREVRFVLGVRF